MKSTKRLLTAAVLVVVLGDIAQMVAVAQRGSANPVIGVWRVSEITYTGPKARTVANPQPGIFIVTSRYYSMQAVTSDAPRREIPLQHSTAGEYAVAFRNFAADTGTYDIDGNELTFKPIVAKTPRVMNSSQVDTFKMEGTDTLWLIQKTNERGAVENPVTIKLTRVD